MKAIVLTDNTAKNSLGGEWGLSVYVEHNGKNILLDAGTTALFADNAEKLGIDLSGVDYAVLSHAHYDHANGMERFFEINKKAKLYIRDGAKEDCYGKRSIFRKYIGIKRGLAKKYRERIEYVSGDFELTDGVWLIPHKTAGLEDIAKKAQLYRKEGRKLVPDNFAHEQSLVLETEKGLVIFNSCSHGGADNIIREISETFAGKKIYAMFGGLHLYRCSDEEVSQYADRVEKSGICKVVTGHCTGERAAVILKDRLGDKVETMYSGYTFEV